MKKVLSVFLTITIFVGMLSVSGLSFTFAATYRAGDVDGDGDITTYDARLLLSQLVAGTTIAAAGDANNDGKINTTDVKTILTRVMNNTTNLTTIDLLAPDVDSWHNPVQTIGSTDCAVTETALSSGYTFTNNGGTWPYAMYIYDAKILVPMNAVIEYDLAVNADSTSINLFTGGDLPEFDDYNNPSHLKLNSFISSSNIDAGSGDLMAGTYSGSINVADLPADSGEFVNGMLWISGIKIYVVGSNGCSVSIRKLTVTGYADTPDVDVSANSYEVIRPSLVTTCETAGLTTLTGLELYTNGSRTKATSLTTSADNKKIYHTQLEKRIVNYADGYRIDVPHDWEPDYSLSELRSQYESPYYCLTVSKEEETPYGNTSSGWQTYLTEWLNRYIADESYLSENNLSYTRTPINSETMLSGYTVMTYDIEINDAQNIAMPFYSIAIIRKFYTYDTFYLMVLKSAVPTQQQIDRLIRSFKEVTAQGTAVNSQGQYERIVPSYWSDETKAYYEKLCTQTTTDFGVFSASMVTRSDGSFSYQNQRISSEYERISTAMDYDYAIMPTYTHLSYYGTPNHFPLDMARTYAGGNGFNGKPVLQFTYQYTYSNNSDLAGYTPVYDIMRGVYDDQFRKLAADIKNYGKPVLFRLNNEMNTDWTSYAGIVTLLDPDIFIITWQRLYDIFEEEGVDNCIWIFNPFDVSTPYCSWGEDLCYMPGADYVQILGLTGYENGNDTTLPSFKSIYTDLYEKNQDNFINYPWVISEFGCGAGGERLYNWGTNSWDTTTLGRNAAKQATWVEDMFDCLNNKSAASNAFCRNIAGAVWFSANDYANINNTNYITNYFELDDELGATFAAFKNGLDEMETPE